MCTQSVITETVTFYRGDVNFKCSWLNLSINQSHSPWKICGIIIRGGGGVARGRGVITVNCVEG